MALLGMGANVQCNGYFPGYYSTRDPIFESEGSTWTSSNVNSELKNDCCHIVSLPVSSPCNLLDYNKELLKQTILKHEAIFRGQIHELHRIYHKQRELMEEVKGNDLYKHNLRLEASWSGSFLSSKNAQKICCSTNLPWSTGQSSNLIAESIQLPLASAQEKTRKICSPPAPTVTSESLKDSKPSESKYRKVGKKILDLQLPAAEYIDNEDGQCSENERVTEVPPVSAYSLNGCSKVVCGSDEKPYGINSNGFAGLNVRLKFEEAASMSYDLGGPTHHRNYPFYDLSRTTKLGSQNLPCNVIRSLDRSLEACSDNPVLDQKKHEQLSRDNYGQIGGALDSFRSLHHVSQPWTHRKFTSGESSAQTQGFTANGLLGPSSASPTCAQYQLVCGDGMVSSGISPAELWKTPVSDSGQSSIAVHPLPFFSTSASFGQSSKPLMGSSGFTRGEIYWGTSGKSDPNLDNQNFFLSSSFCSRSKLSDLRSISTNDPKCKDNRGSSDSHAQKTYLKGSKDAGKNLNLNITPAGCFDTTSFQSTQITGEENQFRDSIRGLPWLREKPVCKGKPGEESKVSTQVESVITNSYNGGGVHGLKVKTEESGLSTEKTLALHCNEKPQMLSDLQPCYVFSSEGFQNQSKNHRIQEIEKECLSDVKKSPCVDVPNSGKQITAAELMMKSQQKKHESVAGIIDLNSCVIEDENMSTDVDFQAPESPENKECSPPRGESDENQLDIPFQLAGQEDPEVQVEQVRVAAEALVSISDFVVPNGLQITICSSSESFTSNPLHWFAGIASTAADHPENETKADFNGKAKIIEEFFPADMDYFEFMTLNLTETKVLDCCYKIIGQTEQVGGSTSPIQPRKGRANRGRWRKDFQSEILPSLASLSRYEVTEDLQAIGSLVAAGTPSETPSLKNAGKNVPARGRKRSYTSTSNDTELQLNLKQLTSITGLRIEESCLISWGKTCKKRRGQRVPTTSPRFILSQVHS